MDGKGFEPSKASPPDLQSISFDHSGIHPIGPTGFEPVTYGFLSQYLLLQ